MVTVLLFLTIVLLVAPSVCLCDATEAAVAGAAEADHALAGGGVGQVGAGHQVPDRVYGRVIIVLLENWCI